jgi:hypothetical protein
LATPETLKKKKQAKCLTPKNYWRGAMGFELANSSMTGRLNAPNDGKMLGSRTDFWLNYAKSCTQYTPYCIILPLALFWQGNRFFM